MADKWKSHSTAFRAQVAQFAVKDGKTINELAPYYGIHPT
jgi:transposase-like protein